MKKRTLLLFFLIGVGLGIVLVHVLKHWIIQTQSQHIIQTVSPVDYPTVTIVPRRSYYSIYRYHPVKRGEFYQRIIVHVRYVPPIPLLSSSGCLSRRLVFMRTNYDFDQEVIGLIHL